MPIRTRVDQPAHDDWIALAELRDPVLVKGVAFGGDRGISRVEFTSDDGATWADARLDYPGTRLTWALWSFDWRPAHPGDHVLVGARHEWRRCGASVGREATVQIRHERISQDRGASQVAQPASLRYRISDNARTRRWCVRRWWRVSATNAMARADAVGFPTLMDEPRLRRIGVIVADDAEGFARDEAGRAAKRAALFCVSAPLFVAGAIFARQRISSAIQLPMPGKPLCKRKTALIGARPWRRKNSVDIVGGELF